MKVHNVQYKLTKPFTLEQCESYLLSSKNNFLIKPHMVSVCKSDLRYYTGNRPKSVLKEKLPLILLHEGIGIVQETKDEFKKGDIVIIIPQLSNSVQTLNCNYIKSNKFLSSSCDGLLQRYICLPKESVLKKPNYISKRLAVLTELISVACHAQTRIKINKNDKIAVLGGGVFGRIMYYTLNAGYENKVSVYGKDDKIKNDYDIVFECVGGINSKHAIDTALKILKPCGTLVLLGVSETKIPIRTRIIIEKGLKLFGSNRSTRNDFTHAIKLLKIRKFRKNISSLIKNKNIPIQNMRDIKKHLDLLSKKNTNKKYILELNIRTEKD